ncbi:2-amino-4-hydroxy-6-hydroxymethyldihydropteridine pyrophosphokinase [mine drainage metagenome]|uniref:2-amino-4-hydroxy-6-hydroxymethyldihydropteridine diphosphokinase n=1 Tax=mine drainage metagenome TaxID=410659 RepID=T0ZDZ3_9ZZZZ
MTLAYIGLGANLGQPEAQLRSAFSALDALARTHLQARSRLWRTPAWGPQPQPDYCNAAACLETTLTPRALLIELMGIERAHGRVRDAVRYGSRTLDLDLLLYGDACIDEADLQVPHPRLVERAFVLLPLAEIAPRLRVPGANVSVSELLARVDAGACQPLHGQV